MYQIMSGVRCLNQAMLTMKKLSPDRTSLANRLLYFYIHMLHITIRNLTNVDLEHLPGHLTILRVQALKQVELDPLMRVKCLSN